MAVHTPQEHAELYGKLRKEILGRFFAYGRYFRANHLSLENTLGVLRQQSSPTPPDSDDANVLCDTHFIARPSSYANAQVLLDKLAPQPSQTSPDPQQVEKHEIERWRVVIHDRENPLLYGSQLFVALAVEYKLGRPEALAVLRAGIESIGYLYKFNHIANFAGYPVRWDAVTSDLWATRERNGKGYPWYCCEFLLDENGHYLYCTPFNHPGYVPFDPTEFYAEDPEKPGSWRTYTTNDQWPDRKKSLNLLRRWEVSMDELVGLMLTYDFVYHMVDDAWLRMEIRRQVSSLSTYLSRHAYLLVRPCGGFNARGASGALPAFEYPFTRVFERILGKKPDPTGSFEEALVAAGVWECVKTSIQLWGLVGIAALALIVGAAGSLLSALLGDLMSIAAGIGGAVGGIAGGYFGYHIGRAFGLWLARDCFDVWNEGQRQEFAGAYLLQKLFSSKLRFQIWMSNVWRGKYARNFPQFIGLTALQEQNNTETTVRDSFLASLSKARVDARGTMGNTGFAAAVATVLGDTNEETNLRKFLDDAYESLAGDSRRCKPKIEDSNDLVIDRVRNAAPGSEDPLGALEYLACLSLSWLHAERLRAAGEQPGAERVIDLPDDGQPWPHPVVPPEVIKEGVLPALDGRSPEREGMLPLFPDRGQNGGDRGGAPQTRMPEAPAPTQSVTREDRITLKVPEASVIVDTGLDIALMDKVEITASGTIWAGVWLTGRNGPNGWNYIENDKRFPCPGTNPFCLLYKIVPNGMAASAISWRKLGDKLGFIAANGSMTGRLLLRTNDDVPGNGNGAFVCEIVVLRT